MRVAIAHDYLTQRGGAERVALAFSNTFPDAIVYTSMYRPKGTFPEFRNRNVQASFLQYLSRFQIDIRAMFILLPFAWRSLKADEADVILASSSGWSHALRSRTATPVVVYCHNPARWLYQPEDYIPNQMMRRIVKPIRRMLISWDQRAARSTTRYIANSTSVAKRIEAAYGISAEVIHPPVCIDSEGDQTAIRGVDPGYWIVVSRSRAYKNVDVVIEGVLQTPEERLVVVGSNPSNPPHGSTDSRIQFVRNLSDAELRWLYANAKGLISVAKEDFGLTPLEANSLGTPVAVLRDGGFLDSTSEGVSGTFIDEPTSVSVATTIQEFPHFDADKVREHASRFSVQNFADQIHRVLENVVQEGLDR